MAVTNAMFIFEVVIDSVKSMVESRFLVIRSDFADIFSLELKDPKQMHIVMPDPLPLPPEPAGKKGKKKKPKPKKPKKGKKGKEEPPPPEPLIQSGQSVLFSSSAEFLIQNMKKYPLEVSLWSKEDNFSYIGATVVPWDPIFLTYLDKICYAQEPPPITLKEEYNIFQEGTAKLMAKLGMQVKLTFLGEKVTTAFRTLSEDPTVKKCLYTGINSKTTSYICTMKTTDEDFAENCNKIENSFIVDKPNPAKKVVYADFKNAPGANLTFFNDGDYCCLGNVDKPPESIYKAPETCPDIDFIVDYVRKIIVSCNDNMRMLTPRPTIKPRIKATDIDKLCYCKEKAWPDGKLAERFKKEALSEPCPVCINAGKRDQGSRGTTFDLANIRGPCGKPDCRIARDMRAYIENLVEEDAKEFNLSDIIGPCGSKACTLAEKIQEFIRHEGVFKEGATLEGLSTQCACVQKMEQALKAKTSCDSICSKKCNTSSSESASQCDGKGCPFKKPDQKVYHVYFFTVEHDIDKKSSGTSTPSSVKSSTENSTFKYCSTECPSVKNSENTACSKSACSTLPDKKPKDLSCLMPICPNMLGFPPSPADSNVVMKFSDIHNLCCVKSCDVAEQVKDFIVDGLQSKKSDKKDDCYCDCVCTFKFSKKTTYCSVCGGYECLGDDMKDQPEYAKPHPCPVYHKLYDKKYIKTPNPWPEDEAKKHQVADNISMKSTKAHTTGGDRKLTASRSMKSLEKKSEKKETEKKKKEKPEKKPVGKFTAVEADQTKPPGLEVEKKPENKYPYPAVPRNMGWNWTADDIPGMKPRPKWKPGAANKILVRRYRAMREGVDIIAKKKRALLQRKKKTEMKPTLIVKKKDGEYTVQMEVFKKFSKERLPFQFPYDEKPPLIYSIGKTEAEKAKLQKQRDRRERRETRRKSRLLQSTFRDRCQEICLKAYNQAIGILPLPNPNYPDCPCNTKTPEPSPLIDSCSCSDEGSISSSDTDGDEWEIQFSPPAALFDPKAKHPPVLTNNECQYSYLDYKVKLLDRQGNQVPRYFKGPDGKQECSDLGGFWTPDHVWVEINKDGYIGPDNRWIPLNFIGPDGMFYSAEEGSFTDNNGNLLRLGIDGYVDKEGKWAWYSRRPKTGGMKSTFTTSSAEPAKKKPVVKADSPAKETGDAKGKGAKPPQVKSKAGVRSVSPPSTKGDKVKKAVSTTSGKGKSPIVMSVSMNYERNTLPNAERLKVDPKKMARYKEIMQGLQQFEDFYELKPPIKTNRASNTPLKKERLGTVAKQTGMNKNQKINNKQSFNETKGPQVSKSAHSGGPTKSLTDRGDQSSSKKTTAIFTPIPKLVDHKSGDTKKNEPWKTGGKMPSRIQENQSSSNKANIKGETTSSSKIPKTDVKKRLDNIKNKGATVKGSTIHADQNTSNKIKGASTKDVLKTSSLSNVPKSKEQGSKGQVQTQRRDKDRANRIKQGKADRTKNSELTSFIPHLADVKTRGDSRVDCSYKPVCCRSQSFDRCSTIQVPIECRKRTEIVVEELESYVACKEFYIRTQFADVFTLNLKDPNELTTLIPNQKKFKRKKSTVRNIQTTDNKDEKVKMQSGQSVLLASNIQTLISNMKSFPIEVSLWDKDNIDDRFGSTHIPWSPTYTEYLRKISINQNPAPAVVIGGYNVFDEYTSRCMATIRLNVKLTFINNKITTSLREHSEDNEKTFIYTEVGPKTTTVLSRIKDTPIDLVQETGIIKTIYSGGKQRFKSSDQENTNTNKARTTEEIKQQKLCEESDVLCPEHVIDYADSPYKSVLNQSIVSLVKSETDIQKNKRADVIRTKSCTSAHQEQPNIWNYIFGDDSGPYGNQVYCVGYFSVENDLHNSPPSSQSKINSPSTSLRRKSPTVSGPSSNVSVKASSGKLDSPKFGASTFESKNSLDIPEVLISISKCKQVNCSNREHNVLSEKPDDRILLGLDNLHQECCVGQTVEKLQGAMTAKMKVDEKYGCYCECSCSFGFTKKTTYCGICGGFEKAGEDFSRKSPNAPFPCPIYHKLVDKHKLKSLSSGSDTKKKGDDNQKTLKANAKSKTADSEKDSKKEKKKKKDDRFKFNYGYTAPQIGHSQCAMPCTGTLGAVPKNMGWLWNAEDVPGIKFRPLWRPGATNKHVVRLLKIAKNPEVITKKKRKDTTKKKALKRPLLVVHKKDGEYTVTMETMKSYPKQRIVSQYPYEDKPVVTYTVGRTEDENRERRKKKERERRRLERDQRRFIQSAFQDMCNEICLKTYQQALGILPGAEDPDCPCYPVNPGADKTNLDISCSCSEDKLLSLGSDTDDDEWIVEFTPPNATFDPTFKSKKVTKMDNTTQYTYLDYRVKLLDRYGVQVPRYFKGPDGKTQCSDLGGFWSPDHKWLEINVDGFIAPDGKWAPMIFTGPSGEQVESELGKFQTANGRWYVIGVDGYVDCLGKWKAYLRPKTVASPVKKEKGSGTGKKGAGDKKDEKPPYKPSEASWSCFGDATPAQLSKMGIVGHGHDKKILLATLNEMLAYGADVTLPQPTTVPRLPSSKKGKPPSPRTIDKLYAERVKCRHPVPLDKGVVSVNNQGKKTYFKLKDYKSMRPKERMAILVDQGKSLSSFHEPCFSSFINPEMLRQQQYERRIGKCASTQVAT